MPPIRPIDLITGKYTTVTPGRTEQYRQGVTQPLGNWQTASVAAGPAYRQGVTAAAGAGRYEAGVQKAGNERWSRKSATLGPERFASGVSQAGPDYQAGFAPYHQVISGTALSARGPVGSEANFRRVSDMANALHRRRVGGGPR